jgi:glycosyltransferase involved in cell wall biosynthesis
VSPRPRFLLSFLAWSSGGLSGGDRHLAEVAARWREQVEVSVLAPPGAADALGPLIGDVAFHELGSDVGPGPALALEYVRRAVGVAVRDGLRVDVVAGASHFVPDAAAVSAGVRRGALGVAYVYHLVGERRDRRARTVWSKSDERVGLALLRRRADVVFVSNEPTEESLRSRGFDTVRTAVGLDVSAFRPANLSLRPPRGVFVGRMTRAKGPIDAVEAWSRVTKQVADAHLVMVGTGPERERARRRASELGISGSVQWPGFVSESEKRRLLSEARVLIAPSYEEGWGIAVCEALASSLPVVAYRLPVLDELFGSAYLAASVGDVDAIAGLAVRVLTDDGLAERLGRDGRETAERYDVDRVAEEELDTILRRRTAR